MPDLTIPVFKYFLLLPDGARKNPLYKQVFVFISADRLFHIVPDKTDEFIHRTVIPVCKVKRDAKADQAERTEAQKQGVFNFGSPFKKDILRNDGYVFPVKNNRLTVGYDFFLRLTDCPTHTTARCKIFRRYPKGSCH